ncbi:MAG: hypothetical protein U0V70_14880 [Terriglobia bacterium]
MKIQTLRRLFRKTLPLGLWIVLCWGAPSKVLAQGCAMCKTTAASQNVQATRALNRGILFLLAPPVTIMGAIFAYAYRRCN